MSPDRAKRQRPARGKSLIPDPPPRNPAVWALFDRDQHPDVPTAFALVRQHNAEAGTKPDMVNVEVAFSNPSFDLWLLLHFQSVNSPQDGSSDWVHEKLRKCPDFSGFARDTAGGKRLNREQAARLMRPDRIAAAVRNARSLAKACPIEDCSVTSGHADNCDPLRRDPSTDLWRFIESLGIDV